MQQSRTHAFTLVELLVSITIISLLMGFLLPALAGARERGNSTVCLSRLRNIMQGHTIVSSENGGIWANYFADPNTEAVVIGSGGNDIGVGRIDQLVSWSGFFDGVLWEDPRGNHAEIVTCPTVYKWNKESYDYVPHSGAMDSYWYSAALYTSSHLWSPSNTEARQHPRDSVQAVKTSAVAHPSSKVVMFEHHDNHADYAPIWAGGRQSNAGFADGHVARVSLARAKPALSVEWPSVYRDYLPSRIPFSSAEGGYLGTDF